MAVIRKDHHAKHRLRLPNTADEPFIIEIARHACVIEDWPLPDPDAEETTSLLPGTDDIAVVATDAAGAMLGAAWTFVSDPPLMTGADGEAIPEVAVAVSSEMRGQGIGGGKLDELVTRCARASKH